jgi:hypothetical protein
MRILTPDRRLRLAPHVRACASEGQVILLDLRNGAYLGIGGETCSALAEHVDGWPRSVDAVHECTTLEATQRIAMGLLQRGLLTDAPSKQAPHATVEEVTASLNAEDGAPDSGVSIRRLTRFVSCAAETSIWLRCRSLEAIAAAVQARRDRLHAASASSSLESTRSATAAYERLRPFAFSAHRNCLHDSLALVAFLASEGAFPRWVIGVKTRPFGAHSWVQMAATVLNDQHEAVRQFQPILVV